MCEVPLRAGAANRAILRAPSERCFPNMLSSAPPPSLRVLPAPAPRPLPLRPRFALLTITTTFVVDVVAPSSSPPPPSTHTSSSVVLSSSSSYFDFVAQRSGSD